MVTKLIAPQLPQGKSMPDVPSVPNFAFRHPSMVDMEAKWSLMDDCLAGELAIKSRKELYLPIPRVDDDERANQERYAGYIQRAVFYNVTRRTLDGLVGEVFSRDPIVELPESLKHLGDDADGSGIALDQQSKMCLSYTMGYGRSGLLADYPKTDGRPATIADLKSGDIKPTVILYPPHTLINWRSKVYGSRRLLTLVVINENIITEDDPFELNRVEQWRVLRLIEVEGRRIYQIQIWRKREPEPGQGSEQEIYDYEEYIPLKADGEPFDRIPFTFVGVINNNETVDDPPMYDMAVLNVAHYRNSADYEESCFIAGQPTAWFSGLTQDWVEDVFKGKVFLGSRAAIPLPVGGVAGLLQVDPNSMPKEAMDQKERQMTALGAKLITQANVSRTLGEAQIEESSANSILATATKNVSRAFTEVLGYASEFVEQGKNEVVYDLNTDFPAARLTPNDRAQLVKEWQDGAITFGEMRDGLRRGGIATEETEVAQREIEANPSPKMKLELEKAEREAKAAEEKKNQPSNAPSGGNQAGQ
ncbi:MAG: DUF4055 domain-containing protein [Acholeplasmataceae bacterium]|nr:DUF4055 domain-containing protein [Acholeplasmataceae bacterium]